MTLCTMAIYFFYAFIITVVISMIEYKNTRGSKVALGISLLIAAAIVLVILKYKL